MCLTSNFPRWIGDSTTPFVFNLAKDLSSLGWTVDVLAPHAPGAATVEQMEEIEVHRFRYAWPEKAETVCYQGGALVNLRRNPIDRIKLPQLVLAQLHATRRLLKQREYDVIHSHWILPQGFSGALMRHLFSVPHVLTVHGGDIFGLRGRVMSSFKKLALNGADCITVNSTFTEKTVRGILQKEKKLVRIPMGVNTNPLADREFELANNIRAKYRKGNGPLIVFVGRLVEEKGVGDLIEAIHLLVPKLKEISLLVVGEGQEKEGIRHKSESMGLRERVHFIGWVDQNEIKAYLGAGDMFVGPSKIASDGWVEAQGLTFIEAMAAGVPVIATKSGGIPDAVRDGQTGLLVPENSPEFLAEAILKLHGDQELQQKLVAGGMELARSEYSREICAERFSRLFEDVGSLRN